MVVGVVGAVTAAVVVSRGSGSGSGSTKARTPLPPVSVAGVATVGQAAPDFALRALDGSAVHLADYRGRPVVINFWASWCQPCRQEFPMLRKELAKRSGSFVLLGVDYHIDITDDARAFARQQHAKWPLLLDPDGTVATAYGVRAVPQTFFVRRDGTIAERVYADPSAKFFEQELAKITAS